MFPQIWKKLRRGPQIVTLKDAALISALTGLQSGDNVVDAGSGSGFLAIYLGSIVAPKGHVVSYEWRPEFATLAKKNIQRAGLGDIVTIKEANIFEGIEESDVDLVTLDLANAERVVSHAHKALKVGGWLVACCPNVEQVKTVVLEAQRLGFVHERTIDAMVRDWLIREIGCRPRNTALVHTTYLSFFTKPASG